MSDIRQVRTRLSTAHTAIESAAAHLTNLSYIEDAGNGDAPLRYMERECHKLLGRLEALEAGLAHIQPDKRKQKASAPRSIIEAGGGS